MVVNMITQSYMHCIGPSTLMLTLQDVKIFQPQLIMSTCNELTLLAMSNNAVQKSVTA